MKFFSLILIIIFISYITIVNTDDLAVDIINEVKRTINLKNSIITIENKITLKKNLNDDTFRYIVSKNNTMSLIRITAWSNKDKKLEMQKT